MKSSARVILLLGAALLGLYFFRTAPREVTLVYTPRHGPAERLEVEIDQGSTVLRRAQFQLSGEHPRALHHVKLPEGEYLVRTSIFGQKGRPGPWQGQQSIRVTEGETIFLPIGD